MSIFNFQLGPIWKQKGRYAGKTCYLIGDGPSVKWFDFSLFTDYPAITCNMFPMHTQFQNLNVLANVLVCPFWFAPHLLRIHRDYLINSKMLSIGYREIIKKNQHIDFLINIKNYPFISSSNISFVNKTASFNRKDQSEFEWFTGGFYSTLGLAIYLGFTRVYLIGFDAWTLNPALEGHWYEREGNDVQNYANPLSSRIDWLSEFIEIKAIGINHSAKCVEIIDYEKITGMAPLYKNNKEIIKDEYIKLLMTNSDYTI